MLLKVKYISASSTSRRAHGFVATNYVSSQKFLIYLLSLFINIFLKKCFKKLNFNIIKTSFYNGKPLENRQASCNREICVHLKILFWC